jgi:hypothetical protein
MIYLPDTNNLIDVITNRMGHAGVAPDFQTRYLIIFRHV